MPKALWQRLLVFGILSQIKNDEIVINGGERRQAVGEKAEGEANQFNYTTQLRVTVWTVS